MATLINFFDNENKAIPMQYEPNIMGERTFSLTDDVVITLSSGREITIPKGFTTDLASIPKWLWSIMQPIDSGFIGDLIHDYLWDTRAAEITYFQGNIFEARKFADTERLKWRKKFASNKRIKNWITHRFLRAFGGLWYSRQLKI